MKRRLCFGIGILLALTFCLSGCGIISAISDSVESYEADQDVIYVSFTKEGKDHEPVDYREVADYQSEYAKYNSRVLYDTLNPAEQQIYRLFEYAMDHECTTIFFDSCLLRETKLSLEEILTCFSMDSAMVQQNYNFTQREYSFVYSYLWELLEFEVTGVEFSVENFSRAALLKKKLALKPAQEIYEKAPKNQNQLEQARFFYRYLTQMVAYEATELEPSDQHNLYDAFLSKKTQCDGFANAFSLLCGMAGIPCVEKISTPKTEDEIGHTWNAFCADGVWYNADLALSEEYVQLHKDFSVDFNFGISDDKIEKEADFAERFPPCTTNLLTVDFTASSPADPALLDGLQNVFHVQGKRFAYFCLQSGELVFDDLQRFANALQLDLQTLDETLSGVKYYYIFKD